MLNYNIYIKDILDAIERIEKSLKRLDKKAFEKDRDIIDATFMRIQVIGESIKKLPLEFKKKHEEINWKKFEETRDIISHAYSKVNMDIIWNLIKNKLPNLKDSIKKIK